MRRVLLSLMIIGFLFVSAAPICAEDGKQFNDLTSTAILTSSADQIVQPVRWYTYYPGYRGWYAGRYYYPRYYSYYNYPVYPYSYWAAPGPVYSYGYYPPYNNYFYFRGPRVAFRFGY